MTRRAVSLLTVAHDGWWERLSDSLDLDAHTVPTEEPLVRILRPRMERSLLDAMGETVFIRYESRARPGDDAQPSSALLERVDALDRRTCEVLHRIQRHAVQGEVVGLQTWDPIFDWEAVRTLLVMGLLEAVVGDPPRIGRHRLSPGLPEPPPIPYDFSDAFFAPPDDLAPARPGPAGILQDAASLAAAILHVEPKRVLAGGLSRADSRKLGRWLGDAALAQGAVLEDCARWGLALRALEALGAVSMDIMDRVLRVDLGLEGTLAGSITEAVHRFVCAVLDRDLHPVLPAIRAALRQAGDDAVDEVVFVDELRIQHRSVLYPRWDRDGETVYPMAAGERPRSYDETGWEKVESRAIERALSRLARIGLIRRAPGVFAATEDGQQWAAERDAPRPPVWVGSDLEIIVPPHSLTPGERFAVERLGRCVRRDVADRIRLERESVTRWLAWHDVDEAVGILLSRAPGVPRSVVETLLAWQTSVCQVVLTRGVIVDL